MLGRSFYRNSEITLLYILYSSDDQSRVRRDLSSRTTYSSELLIITVTISTHTSYLVLKAASFTRRGSLYHLV